MSKPWTADLMFLGTESYAPESYAVTLRWSRTIAPSRDRAAVADSSIAPVVALSSSPLGVLVEMRQVRRSFSPVPSPPPLAVTTTSSWMSDAPASPRPAAGSAAVSCCAARARARPPRGHTHGGRRARGRRRTTAHAHASWRTSLGWLDPLGERHARPGAAAVPFSGIVAYHPPLLVVADGLAPRRGEAPDRRDGGNGGGNAAGGSVLPGRGVRGLGMAAVPTAQPLVSYLGGRRRRCHSPLGRPGSTRAAPTRSRNGGEISEPEAIDGRTIGVGRGHQGTQDVLRG